MNDVVAARKAVYRFLYRRRVDEPTTYFSTEDLSGLARPELVDASLRFGRELGHLDAFRKSHYRLTAAGMIFVEQNGWVEEGV